MKIVTTEDHTGKKHRYAVPDNMPERDYEHGLKMDPPDLGNIDWGGLEIDIHNALIDLGIANWRDWQKQQHRIQGAVLRPLLRRLIALLKTTEPEEEEVTDNGL